MSAPSTTCVGISVGCRARRPPRPFDSLVWDRARLERIFGIVHRLEAYTPAADRVHGYFAMPVLAGGRIVGRVDPGRRGTTLLAKRVTTTADAVPAVAGALTQAAGWVGCDAVEVVETRPASLRAALRRALRESRSDHAR